MYNRLKRTRALTIFLVLLMTMVIITACTNSEERPSVDNDSNASVDVKDIVDWDFYNERATAFVSATAKGEPEVAIAMFDETMSQLVSADGLTSCVGRNHCSSRRVC